MGDCTSTGEINGHLACVAACEACITETGEVLPQAETAAAYQAVYEHYRGLYPALKPTFQALG